MIAQIPGLQDASQASGLQELSAAILQLAVTLGLAWLCASLHRVYRKPVYAWWSVAWLLYLVRLAAIVTFLVHRDPIALYWHQVLTGWTALAVLGTATVFARGGVRRRYVWLAVFPPLWSYVAIYHLDSFGWAAAPAVAFLSAATLLTGFVFWRYARRVKSTGATVLSVAFLLWGIHHLDYPFLRPRGAWVPWGYYLDVVFELAVGAGILLLVADDLRRGLDALTTLSGELQSDASRPRPVLLDALLARPLTLPSVRGAAMYSPVRGTYERGAGVCGGWQDRAPSHEERTRLDATVATGKATTHTGWFDPDGTTQHPFAAVLPVADAQSTTGALVIVGEARAPFAVLDETFLTALGQQVGGALSNAALTERLRQRSTDLERLSARMVQQHEEERRRLSRELHDETAQVLSALKIELGVLRRIVPAGDQGRVDDASALVDAGIRSIRAVTNELRPALLDDLGLIPALRSLVTAFAAHSPIQTSLQAPEDGTLPSLSADAELALFRALQEGLANVVRHADARRVNVSISATHGVVTMVVADDGVGFSAGAANGGAMGLTGMRERVAALGGTVAIDSTAGSGTRLRITLDVEAPK
jgi:signal transduction histidine kinase